MTINLTVLVQFVHFMIAYFILERVLFRPSVSALKIQDALFHKKVDHLAEGKKKVEALRFQLEEDRKMHREELQKSIPTLARFRKPLSIEEVYESARYEETAAADYANKATIKAIVQRIVGSILHD